MALGDVGQACTVVPVKAKSENDETLNTNAWMTMNPLWEEMANRFPTNSRTLDLLDNIPGLPACMMAKTLHALSSMDQGILTPDLESLGHAR